MPNARIPIFIVCVAALAVLAFKRLSFNVDPLDLLPQDLREVEGIREFVAGFLREGEFVIALHQGKADPEDESLESEAASLAGALQGRPELVQRVEWQPSWESQPNAAAQLPAYLWFNGPPADLQALAGRLAEGASRETIAAALDELSFGVDPSAIALAAYDPLGLLRPPSASAGTDFEGGGGRFAAADGSMRVLYLSPREGALGYRDAADWISEVTALVDAWRGDDPAREALRIGYTGELAFEAEIGVGMQRDMTGSITGAVVLIHLLFWLMHRRLLPLAAMFLSLLLILSLAVIAGSLVFGRLSVMSVGFAAILVGLAVDYGVVLYGEARAQGSGSRRELFASVGPPILWAAFTTAAVFASLGLSSLPGIRELGGLVTVGIVLGASVMLLLFGPLAAALGGGHPLRASRWDGHRALGAGPALAITGILLGGALLVLILRGPPPLHTSFDTLRPRHSDADAAYRELGTKLAGADEPGLPLLVRGDSREDLARRLPAVRERLDSLRDEGHLRSATLVPALVPSVEGQRQNRRTIRSLLDAQQRLKAELDEAFEPEASAAMLAVFGCWAEMLESGEAAAALPPSEEARRLLSESFVESTESATLLGYVELAPDRYSQVRAAIGDLEGVYLTGWGTIGPAVRPLVIRDLVAVFVPMAVILLAMLAIVFRKLRDVVLATAVLVVSAVLLMGLMRALGWQWTLVNLCAFPLLLGTGIDYTVHMIAALRRHSGDPVPIRRGIARALLFCGLSTAIGFGSLAFANNSGLSSLGRVCAAGILITMAVAVVLLPAWWRSWTGLRFDRSGEGS